MLLPSAWRWWLWEWCVGAALGVQMDGGGEGLERRVWEERGNMEARARGMLCSLCVGIRGCRLLLRWLCWLAPMKAQGACCVLSFFVSGLQVEGI